MLCIYLKKDIFMKLAFTLKGNNLSVGLTHGNILPPTQLYLKIFLTSIKAIIFI